MNTKSILIKDTTREQREKIVAESLSWDDGSCDTAGSEIDYQLYIDGKKELRELNDEYRARYIKASAVNAEPEKSGCSYVN